MLSMARFTSKFDFEKKCYSCRESQLPHVLIFVLGDDFEFPFFFLLFGIFCVVIFL